MKVVFKGLFLAGILALLLLGGNLAWLASLRLDKIADLESNSQIAQTSLGPIEYSAQGEGPPVLVLHGILGGYDQGFLACDSLAAAGFRVLAVSRSGYLRTPLGIGTTPEQQADAMAALLDVLDISRVSVLAWSAGGPIAIQFAVRHPDKIAALVLVSPVTERFQALDPALAASAAKLAGAGFLYETAAPLFARYLTYNPREVLHRTLSVADNSSSAQRRAIAEYVVGDPAQLEWFGHLLNTLAPLDRRMPGVHNDLAQHRALQALPFEKITTPTLIIHGQADKIVPYASAERTAARIPGAVLRPVPGTGHLVQLGPEATSVRQTILNFLRAHS